MVWHTCSFNRITPVSQNRKIDFEKNRFNTACLTHFDKMPIIYLDLNFTSWRQALLGYVIYSAFDSVDKILKLLSSTFL